MRTAATEEAARRIWVEQLSQETDPLTSGPTLFKGEGAPSMIFCGSSMKWIFITEALEATARQ
jgi:hypothetical protein